MAITKEDVQYVAELARLTLTAEEVETYTRQLADILDFIGQLNVLDTEKIPPTSHVLDIKNVMREDVVAPSLPVETVLKNAPDQEDGFFKVPAVLE